MKKLLALLLAVLMLLFLVACGQNEAEKPTTTTAEPTTQVPEDSLEHYDLSQIDLVGIGELLAQREEYTVSRIRLDGLCTPVVLELRGTNLVSISAYGITAFVDPASAEYAGIYGNVSPTIYEHQGLIFLNVWKDNIGYSCVMCPDGTYLETFPDKEYSVMIYVNSEGQMVQSQFARKFMGIEQWETGPIDMAFARDDFYYSIDKASWTEEAYSVTSGESYTISDCFDLDEIFVNAKLNGLYPEFDTLDELLTYNAMDRNPDSVREEVSYFDELRAAYDYDSHRNLITETFYTLANNVYFIKNHTYDDRDLDVAGSWHFCGQEVYRYTHSYDSKERLIETVWYQGDQEVERFAYTYHSEGGHTETFYQNGEKKYTYTFDESGELIAHSIYEDGKQSKTKDVKSLVKTQLLTDIWFPIVDNDTLHFDYRYDGTFLIEAPKDAKATTAADGSYILTHESIDEEDGERCQHEYHYDANDHLVKVVHCAEGSEFLRDEYQYNSKGLRIEQTTYLDGEQDMISKFEYNRAGLLTRLERTYVSDQTDYILTNENGNEVTKEYTYTVHAETYRYNAQGLLVEIVYYADDLEIDRDTFEYDANGYVLPSMDTYQYEYNAEGILETVWLVYEDWSAGAVQLRSRTVYVTQENARQLQEIMRNKLSWF